MIFRCIPKARDPRDDEDEEHRSPTSRRSAWACVRVRLPYRKESHLQEVVRDQQPGRRPLPPQLLQ